MDALCKWKAAKVHLTEALQNYLQCCINLESALSHPISGTPDSANSTSHASLENNVLDVCAEMPSIDLISTQLSEAHAYVNKSLNRLPTLVPIAVLPPVILAHIFSLATSTTCPLTHQYLPDMLLVIPSVCSWLRRLAISACFLWSHIDVGRPSGIRGDGGFLDQVQLRLERAAHIPVCLHVEYLNVVFRGSSENIIEILEPYLDSLASLDLCVRDSPSALVPRIFERFARSCTSGSSKSLALLADPSDPPFHPEPFRVPLTFCEGLVALQLNKLPSSILSTFDQLADLISRNRSLRTLQLKGLPPILFPDQPGHSNPITLPDLEVLDLVDTHTSVVVQLLSLLASGNPGLRVRLAISDNEEMISASLQFLRHSTVKALCFRHLDSPQLGWLTQCSPFLQHLHTLHIYFKGSRTDINYTALATDESTPILPSLQTVCLERAMFEDSSFDELV